MDALRGVAVLGIFWINIVLFALPDAAVVNPVAVGGEGLLNYGLWTFGAIFVEGTMRGLFSIMFGASMVLFIVHAEQAADPRAGALYYRRTVWLILFGLIHLYVLLMPDDILLVYGIAGLFLFPFRKLAARTLMSVSAVILIGVTVLSGIEGYSQAELKHDAADARSRAAAGEILGPADNLAIKEWRKVQSETWPGHDLVAEEIEARLSPVRVLFEQNADAVNEFLQSEDVIYWLTDVWTMMFLGMALLKWRVLTGERSRRFYAGLMAAGYAIGLPLKIREAWVLWQSDFEPADWVSFVPDETARIALTLGHIGLFFTIWHSGALGWLMRRLEAVGRMALTNYIGQTVIANLIFSGVGFALFGKLERVYVHSIMAGIWIAQIWFSMWWLARFRFGPLEWLWRSLTYMKIQKLRIAG
ncbi:MAG: DUF418 domain-containing protein [Rhodospirillales bacterium]